MTRQRTIIRKTQLVLAIVVSIMVVGCGGNGESKSPSAENTASSPQKSVTDKSRSGELTSPQPNNVRPKPSEGSRGKSAGTQPGADRHAAKPPISKAGGSLAGGRVPLMTTQGPSIVSLAYPPPGGWAMTSDNVTLILSIPSRAELVYIDTLRDKEIRRLELDFKPSKLAMQGDTLFAAVDGGSKVHALDPKTGKIKKTFALPGEALQALACHPEKGMIYAADLTERVYALDPQTGKVTRTEALGMFVAVDPIDGKAVYCATNIPSKEFLETSRGPGDTVRFRLVTVTTPCSVRKYSVNGSALKLVGANLNAAIGAGGYLQISPDGKRYAMIAGGGWWSTTNKSIRHQIAVFESNQITSMAGALDTKMPQISGFSSGGPPQSIAFHPVLNLGVVSAAGFMYHFFNPGSLVVKSNRQVRARPMELSANVAAARAGFKLLTFGGRGTRLIASQHGSIVMIPLDLSDADRAALTAKYGPLPPKAETFVTFKNPPEGWNTRAIRIGMPFLLEERFNHHITKVPQELIGGILIERPVGPSHKWLTDEYDVSVSRDARVFVAISPQQFGESATKATDFKNLIAEGWKEHEQGFELKAAAATKWRLFWKPVKKGPIKLTLKKKFPPTQTVFMFTK